VPQSQSNLTSLATLLENAEARHSALPPPMVEKRREDSGVIDFMAIHKRAEEERISAAAAASTRTPVPMVAPVPDADVMAAVAATQKRKKRFVIGAVAGGATLVGMIIAVVSLTGNDASPKTAAAEPAPVVAPPPPAPAPPPAATEAPVAAAQPAAPAETPAPTPAPAPAKHKAHKHSSSSQSKGPKMMKVTSGGVAG
jgi:hypothetical protein